MKIELHGKRKGTGLPVWLSWDDGTIDAFTEELADTFELQAIAWAGETVRLPEAGQVACSSGPLQAGRGLS